MFFSDPGFDWVFDFSEPDELVGVCILSGVKVRPMLLVLLSNDEQRTANTRQVKRGSSRSFCSPVRESSVPNYRPPRPSQLTDYIWIVNTRPQGISPDFWSRPFFLPSPGHRLLLLKHASSSSLGNPRYLSLVHILGSSLVRELVSGWHLFR